MRRFFVIISAFILFSSFNVAAQQGGNASKTGAIDPDGFYMLDGDPPVALKGFEHIALLNNKGKIEGRLFSGGKGYTLQKINFSGKSFSFETAVVGGKSYAFNGAFLRDGKYAEVNPDGVVLKGHFIVRNAGGVSSETNVGFTYFVGD